MKTVALAHRVLVPARAGCNQAMPLNIDADSEMVPPGVRHRYLWCRCRRCRRRKWREQSSRRRHGTFRGNGHGGGEGRVRRAHRVAARRGGRAADAAPWRGRAEDEISGPLIHAIFIRFLSKTEGREGA